MLPKSLSKQLNIIENALSDRSMSTSLGMEWMCRVISELEITVMFCSLTPTPSGVRNFVDGKLWVQFWAISVYLKYCYFVRFSLNVTMIWVRLPPPTYILRPEQLTAKKKKLQIFFTWYLQVKWFREFQFPKTYKPYSKWTERNKIESKKDYHVSKILFLHQFLFNMHRMHSKNKFWHASKVNTKSETRLQRKYKMLIKLILPFHLHGSIIKNAETGIQNPAPFRRVG